jgi:lysophospholipase L1-like esterase
LWFIPAFLTLMPATTHADEPRSPSRPEPQTLSAKEWTRLSEYHRAQLNVRRADICFVGDSLTEFWNAHGRAAWQQHFRGWQAVNCGIAADRTEHILFRLQALDLANAKPRALVLMMGTNNLGMEPPDSPEEVAKACAAALDIIQKASPETRILLLTIPPSGPEPNSALRRSIRTTNDLLRRLAKQRDVPVLDTYPLFVNENDAWLSGLTLDGTHFTADAYEILAQALQPKLAALLGPAPK